MSIKVKNHKNFACFDYKSNRCSKHKLGDVVFRPETDEIGVIIQIHSEGEYRTDMFGNCCLSEIKNATITEIKTHRPDLVKDLLGVKTFKESQENFVKTCKRVDHIRKEIERLQRLKTKLWNSKKTSWTENLIRPLLNEVKDLMPEITGWDDDRLIPMGLMCRVSVFPKYNGKSLYLPFLPGNTDEGELLIETDKRTNEYPEDSVAYLNGLGKESITVESAEQIVEILRKQIEKHLVV